VEQNHLQVCVLIGFLQTKELTTCMTLRDDEPFADGHAWLALDVTEKGLMH
jgi:hypothetical protein